MFNQVKTVLKETNLSPSCKTEIVEKTRFVSKHCSEKPCTENTNCLWVFSVKFHLANICVLFLFGRRTSDTYLPVFFLRPGTRENGRREAQRKPVGQAGEGFPPFKAGIRTRSPPLHCKPSTLSTNHIAPKFGRSHVRRGLLSICITALDVGVLVDGKLSLNPPTPLVVIALTTVCRNALPKTSVIASHHTTMRRWALFHGLIQKKLFSGVTTQSSVRRESLHENQIPSVPL